MSLLPCVSLRRPRHPLLRQGPTAFVLLLRILSNGHREASTGVLLGAVFVVGMCMWGAQRVATVSVSITTVLLAMTQACTCGQTEVACEVRCL